MEGQRFIILSNWRSTLVPQPATPHDSSQQQFADQLYRVKRRSHEVTDLPHQARVGAFELFHTYNSLTCQIVVSCLAVNQVGSHAPIQLFAILGTRRLVDVNTCLESAYMPCLHRVDCIKIVDNINVKYKRAGNAEDWTALVSIRRYFFLDCLVIAAYSNCLTQ